jgi:hypothetical protein
MVFPVVPILRAARRDATNAISERAEFPVSLSFFLVFIFFLRSSCNFSHVQRIADITAKVPKKRRSQVCAY